MFTMELTERAIDAVNISSGRCFLCGDTPSTGQGEHIFPKWLQKHLNIWDDQLTLLNGTRIPYSQLTIPCCEHCNNGVLSKIENNVKQILTRSSNPTEDETLFLGRWMAKILVGILFKESSLLLDRSNPNLGTIFPPSMVDDFYHTHLILNTARVPTSFDCLHWNYPFSLYHYRVDEGLEKNEFDLSTNVFGNSISIRVGTHALVFISDGGMQMEHGMGGPFNLAGKQLHPLQFKEISARVHYKSTLRDATHRYIISENERNIQMSQTGVQSYSPPDFESNEIDLFREWNEKDFADAVTQYLGSYGKNMYDPETNSCRTYLVDENGKFANQPKISP